MIMKRFITILCGALSCIAAAFLNFYVQDITTINIFSFTMFFVAPIGAIAVGMAANSGYYFSALITNRMLDKYDFISMVVMAAIGMILIYFIEYYFYIEKEGLSKGVTFLQYIAYVVENSTIHVKFMKWTLFNKLGSMGIWGYLFLFIHFIGFILGGAITFLLLKFADVCSTCSKYLHKKQNKVLFFNNNQRFDKYQNEMDGLEPTSSVFRSILFDSDTGLDKVQGSIKYTWQLKKCNACNFELLKGEAEIYKGKEWTALKSAKRKIIMPADSNLEMQWDI